MTFEQLTYHFIDSQAQTWRKSNCQVVLSQFSLHLSNLDNADCGAAICHDFEHPGVNNDFLIKTSDLKALRYNVSTFNFPIQSGSGLSTCISLNAEHKPHSSGWLFAAMSISQTLIRFKEHGTNLSEPSWCCLTPA